MQISLLTGKQGEEEAEINANGAPPPTFDCLSASEESGSQEPLDRHSITQYISLKIYTASVERTFMQNFFSKERKEGNDNQTPNVFCI